MKKIVFLIFLTQFTLSKAQPKKILFIGNSYVYTNDLPAMLYALALSNGDTIIHDNSAPGGYTFAQHTTNATTLAKINAQDWDYVILQEQSQMPSFPPAQVQSDTYPYAEQLNDLIQTHDSCTQTVFFMTWGRKYGDAANCAFYPPLCTFDGMQARLRESYLAMGNANEALVTPVGQAFKYARMADSTINLYSPDNSHPSVAGTYLAACTFYATLYQTSPVGLSFTAGLAANEATFLQQIAQQTVFDSLSTWNINAFTPHAVYTVNTTGLQQYQYQFTNASTNVTANFWNFGDGTNANTANPLHTFSGPGTYTISLTVSDGCTSHTTTQDLVVSSLNSLQENNESSLQIIHQFQQLNINFRKAEINPVTITVIDISGHKVYTKISTGKQSETINTTGWSKGIYVVQLFTDDQLITKKITIQ